MNESGKQELRNLEIDSPWDFLELPFALCPIILESGRFTGQPARKPDRMKPFSFIVALGVLLLLPASVLRAQTDDAPKIPDLQLDALVAPVALYPDPLLSQVLVASTYPLEIMQLHQFLQNNPHLKDKALGDGVELKPWDPSIKAMAI